MKTAVTEMLDIEFPIFAFSHCRDVVAAVSKAGGLGVLGAVATRRSSSRSTSPGSRTRSATSPYGVDLIVPAKYAGDEGGGYTLDDIRQLIPAEHIGSSSTTSSRRYEVPELPVDDDARSARPRSPATTAAPRSRANAAGPAARDRARPPDRASSPTRSGRRRSS